MTVCSVDVMNTWPRNGNTRLSNMLNLKLHGKDVRRSGNSRKLQRYAEFPL